MKKIGFMDYYLDEWHAKEYPKLIDELSSGEFKVCYAYGEIDSPTGVANVEWAKEFGAELLNTIEEVVLKSDFLVVLSPDNPEMHEKLAEIPLKSGKHTYIDKTFSSDKATAERIFTLAEKYNTKCYSSSALRYADEYNDINKSDIVKIYSQGPGSYEIYSVHQLEPIVMLMGVAGKRVMFTGDNDFPSMIIEFTDGRFAYMSQYHNSNFELTLINKDNLGDRKVVSSEFFKIFISEMLDFFETGTVKVKAQETIDIMAIREAGLKAIKTPFKWVNV